ncbi:tyrosine-type recombinase/integrase [Campylobacter sp. faydin G-105]|uniref:tyrosine-type recombinase/integrase n=1 Tax=Campylobacter anatolicus TaxID=2829105 RepID=UPI001B95B76A|nr:integrase arm-type DNA-binding domain-containing protein [Campylobacter anatolicus]MBR8461523.1 tyrosine-type recombinase/integrase [Campylobacter anatolicus]
MPKINPPLLDSGIKALKPKDKIYKKSDGRNLFLFIEPNGRKFFAFEYKSPVTNKIRRMALGNYPELSLSKAREKRRELSMQVKNGNDPLIDKKACKNTLQDIAMRWIEIKSANITHGYHKRQILIFNKHISPYLGQRSIQTIKAIDIINTLKIIEKDDKLETIKRLFVLLNQIYRYAVSYEIVAHNIIADINFKYTFKSAKVKNFPTITDTKDIKNLLLAIDEYNGNISTKVALKFGIYTAARPFNIRHAEWVEFDFKNKIWSIEADKMKMKNAFKLPLSDSVVNLLIEYKKICGNSSNYLFPSVLSNKRAMSDNTLTTALRRMGYTKDELVVHGFRAMFSTIANENINAHKCNADIIEKCLAHKEKDKIRSAYNRAQNLSEMRALMQWWAEFLDGLTV